MKKLALVVAVAALVLAGVGGCIWPLGSPAGGPVDVSGAIGAGDGRAVDVSGAVGPSASPADWSDVPPC